MEGGCQLGMHSALLARRNNNSRPRHGGNPCRVLLVHSKRYATEYV